ncbi:MAG: hypothetical protein R2769_07900 [Saprospiraceae bacterium]
MGWKTGFCPTSYWTVDVCPTGIVTYSVDSVPGATNYHWSVRKILQPSLMDKEQEILRSDLKQQPEPEKFVFALPMHVMKEQLPA